MNNVKSLKTWIWHFITSEKFRITASVCKVVCFSTGFAHQLLEKALYSKRKTHETIERVFVKLKLNPFFLCLILAIFPEQGMKEEINFKFGLP